MLAASARSGEAAGLLVGLTLLGHRPVEGALQLRRAAPLARLEIHGRYTRGLQPGDTREIQREYNGGYTRGLQPGEGAAAAWRCLYHLTLSRAISHYLARQLLLRLTLRLLRSPARRHRRRRRRALALLPRLRLRLGLGTQSTHLRLARLHLCTLGLQLLLKRGILLLRLLELPLELLLLAARLRWREIEGDEGRWREMEGDGGRWRKMEGDGGRWREMEVYSCCCCLPPHLPQLALHPQLAPCAPLLDSLV